MAGLTNVRGLAELQKFLDRLTPKMEKNVMRGALRAGMKVVQPVAQSLVHSVSGQLAAGLKIGTKSRGGTVQSNLKAKGVHGSAAHLVEFGTAAHTITAAPGSALQLHGGQLVQSVEHPGARPKPFMRPALDSQTSTAVNASAHYIRARLAKKHGLDTAHIKLDGDE
jgi:HK97 gp10 family phage protein